MSSAISDYAAILLQVKDQWDVEFNDKGLPFLRISKAGLEVLGIGYDASHPGKPVLTWDAFYPHRKV